MPYLDTAEEMHHMLLQDVALTTWPQVSVIHDALPVPDPCLSPTRPPCHTSLQTLRLGGHHLDEPSPPKILCCVVQSIYDQAQSSITNNNLTAFLLGKDGRIRVKVASMTVIWSARYVASQVERPTKDKRLD